MGMIDRGFWTLVFTSLCTSVDFLLRSKRLQSSHGAKVRAGGKKRLEGGGGGSFFPLPLPRHSFFFFALVPTFLDELARKRLSPSPKNEIRETPFSGKEVAVHSVP